MEGPTIRNKARLAATVAAVTACALLAASALRSRAGQGRPGAAAGVADAVSAPEEKALSEASAEMARAATNLWNALTPEQQKAMAFEFTDQERQNWHFIPRERKGVSWKQLTPAQRHLAHALLATGLSQDGYATATTIMSLEQVLAEIEKGKGPVRDPELYFFSVFGQPSAEGTWGWRVEGHHLSLNFTVVNGKGAVAAPAFFGANPAEVRDGPQKGLRALAAEEDLGFKLVRGLSEEQKKKAVIAAKAPDDIITGAERKANPGEPTGLPYGELSAEQQALLRVLVHLYADRQRGELAHQDLAQIEQAGWDNVRFAWAGATEPGVGHYYRLHGPTFLIEFDNTQTRANHIHTVWRDLADDFGEDLLRKHYEQDHAQPGGK